MIFLMFYHSSFNSFHAPLLIWVTNAMIDHDKKQVGEERIF